MPTTDPKVPEQCRDCKFSMTPKNENDGWCTYAFKLIFDKDGNCEQKRKETKPCQPTS